LISKIIANKVLDTTFQGKSPLITIYFDDSTCSGYLKKSAISDELADRWFGVYHGDKLVLNLVEIAYLMLLPNSNVIVNSSQGSEIRRVDELVEKYGNCFDKYFWPMLAVFKDLRERGRRVRVLGPCKLLVKDKSGDLRLVYVLEEKLDVNMRSFQEIVNEAYRNNFKAALAIVSLQGELTYYDIVPADIRAGKSD